MTNERLNRKQTIIALLIIGIVMVFVRWLFILLPASFFMDALIYGVMGYILGNHIYYGKWRWGFLLALPAMIGILYFFISATIATSTTDLGLKNIISFLIIPASACAGIWLKNNKAIQRH